MAMFERTVNGPLSLVQFLEGKSLPGKKSRLRDSNPRYPAEFAGAVELCAESFQMAQFWFHHYI
jgi:hypothetical protein